MEAIDGPEEGSASGAMENLPPPPRGSAVLARRGGLKERASMTIGVARFERWDSNTAPRKYPPFPSGET